jgi:hypothetical protein
MADNQWMNKKWNIFKRLPNGGRELIANEPNLASAVYWMCAHFSKEEQNNLEVETVDGRDSYSIQNGGIKSTTPIDI